MGQFTLKWPRAVGMTKRMVGALTVLILTTSIAVESFSVVPSRSFRLPDQNYLQIRSKPSKNNGPIHQRTRDALLVSSSVRPRRLYSAQRPNSFQLKENASNKFIPRLVERLRNPLQQKRSDWQSSTASSSLVSSVPNSKRLRRTLSRRVWSMAFALVIGWNTLASSTMASSSTPPVPVATTTSSVAMSSSSSSSAASLMRQEQIKLDALVDRYVRQHMFDDDSSVSDPTSATYREILDDVNTGKHPTAIRSVVKDVEKSLQYKSNSIMDSATTTSKTMRTWTAGSLLTSLVRGVQRRTGWTDAVATMALAGVFVVAGPSAFLLAGIMVGNISKRNMDQLFKKRYGDTYTVDATVKQEPLVEAPSDDEEDDDDENDNDDEENDDNKPKQK